jgi:hypothetical protein
MAADNPTDCRPSDPASPAAQDRYDQGIVLVHVVTHYPTNFRVSDLVRELTDDSQEFSERDRIERAARDLVAVGLLFRSDGLVLPTRAALRFNEVLSDGEGD